MVGRRRYVLLHPGAVQLSISGRIIFDSPPTACCGGGEVFPAEHAGCRQGTLLQITLRLIRCSGTFLTVTDLCSRKSFVVQHVQSGSGVYIQGPTIYGLCKHRGSNPVGDAKNSHSKAKSTLLSTFPSSVVISTLPFPLVSLPNVSKV